METKTLSTEVVKNFFNAFGNGDLDGIINTFHEDATIIAVRAGERKGSDLYGTYKGKEGVKEFVSNLGSTFNTKAFFVQNIIGKGEVAFANGSFTHQLKSTSKDFTSDWSLYVVVKDDKIYEYHFYEDSAAYVEANSKP